jgi:uncharacterized integral membrane protein
VPPPTEAGTIGGVKLPQRLREGPEQGVYVLLGVAAVALLYVVGFVVSNSESVPVDFVLFTARASLIWVIVIPLLIGGVAGYALARMRGRAQAERRTAQPSDDPVL